VCAPASYREPLALTMVVLQSSDQAAGRSDVKKYLFFPTLYATAIDMQ
jgi:hypothetical protein